MGDGRTWQGRQDSNLRMAESKSDVLPLHHAPTLSPAPAKRMDAFCSPVKREKRRDWCFPIPPFVGWVKGLEPSTPGTTIRCSNQLSYTHHRENGTPEGTRTPGLLLRRQLLYPAELLALMHQNPQPCLLERVKGIEPSYPAWKAGVLPLNYTRKLIKFSMKLSACQVFSCMSPLFRFK